MPSPLLVRATSYLGLFAFMLFLEQLRPYARSDQKKSFRVAFHFSLSILNSLVLYGALTGTILAAVHYTRNHSLGLAHVLELQGGLEILVTVVALDFWNYWMHLANHKIRFLWRFHKAHHSDMEMDVTTASRFHVGELLISNSIKCLAILVWGPSLGGLVAFDAFLTGCSQFHHSNVNIPLSVQDDLEKLIVTPRMHRCHHSLHRHCFNTNYATIFSLWDRLFGTYHHAKVAHELERIGLFSPRGPATMKLIPFIMTPLKKTK